MFRLQIVLFGFMNNLLSQVARLIHETHPFGANAIFCSRQNIVPKFQILHAICGLAVSQNSRRLFRFLFDADLVLLASDDVADITAVAPEQQCSHQAKDNG